MKVIMTTINWNYIRVLSSLVIIRPYNKLKCSLKIILLMWFLIYSILNYAVQESDLLYIYTLFFHYGLSQDILNIVPVLYSRTFVYPFYIRWLASTNPNSQSIPPRHLLAVQVYSLCLWILFLDKHLFSWIGG